MTRHEDQRHMPYQAEEIFALVADIQSYPQFLPWCVGARIRERHEIAPQVEELTADLMVAFAAFREKFGSKVTLDQAQLQIDVNYLDGPFRKLINQWRFSPEEGGCRVEFFVEFEFKSKILELAIGQVFDHAMRKIVAAFEERAASLYTPKNE